MAFLVLDRKIRPLENSFYARLDRLSTTLCGSVPAGIIFIKISLSVGYNNGVSSVTGK